MKSLVIITPFSSVELVNKYRDYDIVGIDEGIFIAKEENIPLVFAISNFKNIDLNQVLSFVNKDKILKYSLKDSYYQGLSKVIDFIYKKGYEKLILLENLSKKFVDIIELAQLIKQSDGKLVVQDENNYISYFSKGNYVIGKQGYSSINLIGFPTCLISVDHLNKPCENVKLNISEDEPYLLDLSQKVAVLKVIEGGVLEVLSNND